MPRAAITVRRSPLLGGIDLVRARFTDLATPLHTHPEVEIGVVTSGRRRVECRGIGQVAEAGSVLVFLPGVAHAGASLDSSGAAYRGFRISRDSLHTMGALERGAELRPAIGAPMVKDAGLCRRLARLHREMFEARSGHAIQRELISVVGALFEPARGPAPVGRGGRVAALARDYIDRHFAERIRLDRLASLSGVSVWYLIRRFRAATGLPPHAYLWQVRVHRAMELLREGHRVSTVAYRSGFVDQSHLARCFKRLVGVPPGEYQRCVLPGC